MPAPAFAPHPPARAHRPTRFPHYHHSTTDAGSTLYAHRPTTTTTTGSRPVPRLHHATTAH
ncbi:hypothetical protein GCM10022224_047880 [Nonomuraea antimicrobica]|uniref:Uncharacterized protein n=1 Tax=Nonomuraea antimicrobica TaxID=561173 RepID=A0ABP7C5Q4_9ACTN